MKSIDIQDRELVHGQTLDFLTTDADVEAVDGEFSLALPHN